MMRKFLVLSAAVAAVAVSSVAVMSSAEAGPYHRVYRNFGAHAFVPPYAPGYRYGMRYRYYDRFGSNLNPDRQMVGIGE